MRNDNTGTPLDSGLGWPGERGNYHSYKRYDFDYSGVRCIIVCPKVVASGRPWIWRARFFGVEPQVELALLEKGFHVAYISVQDLYGNPMAVERWNRFYTFLTSKHGFDKKVVLEGFSRGGLIVYNWATKNPEKVHCIYADAPVCDIRSWPGGKMNGKGAPADWQRCLHAYNLTELSAADFAGNPIDGLLPLAESGVPILHVVGDEDVVVPVIENTDVLEKRYVELGGSIEVIHKPDCGHHPHSLVDPSPIVDFILKAVPGYATA